MIVSTKTVLLKHTFFIGNVLKIEIEMTEKYDLSRNMLSLTQK